MATNNAVNSPLSGTTGSGNFVGSISPTISNPTILNAIYDSNGNIIIELVPQSASINYVAIANAATNGQPIIAAVGSDTNIPLVIRGQGTGGVAIGGVTGGVTFASGYVGEVISSTITSASGTSYTSGNTTNITSISLTQGNWDLFGNIGITGTTVGVTIAGITSTSATLTTPELTSYINPNSTSATVRLVVPSYPVNISTTTTYYLVVLSTGTGSMTMYGNIYARRRV